LAIDRHQTIADLADEVIRACRAPRNLSSFVIERPASETRVAGALKTIGVIVPDKPKMFDLEERMKQQKDLVALRECMKHALRGYEYVLIDLPGNIDRRNKLAFSALLMSDFVLIPIEPSEISLSALPVTFDLIHQAQTLGARGKPAVIGLVLNKTDKRTEQY